MWRPHHLHLFYPMPCISIHFPRLSLPSLSCPLAGNPAVFLRKLKPEETAFLGESAEHYARLAAEHAQVGMAH